MTRFLLQTGALSCALSIAAASPAAAMTQSPAGIPPKSAPPASAGDAVKPIDKRPAAKWHEARFEASSKCPADDSARGHGPAGAESKDKKLIFKEATEKL